METSKIYTTLEKLRYYGYGFIVDSFVCSGPRLSDYKKVKLEVVAETKDGDILTKVAMRFGKIWDYGNAELTADYEDFDFFEFGSDVPYTSGYGVGLLIDKKHLRCL